MTKLTVELSEKGVHSVTAKCKTIADANTAGLISGRIALPLSLVHGAIQEINNEISENGVCPTIWVTRNDDGDDFKFEQLPLCVAPPIQDLWDMCLVPGWFILAMSTGFCITEQHLEKWSLCHFNEAAVDILVSTQTWASGAGWSVSYNADGIDEVLAVEFVQLDQKDIAEISAFCKCTSLTFRVRGEVWGQPSAAFRIEIFPKTESRK